MFEMTTPDVAVIGCFASEDAIGALEAIDVAYRIAPDEAMLVGARGQAQALLDTAAAIVLNIDPDAVVLDATDGWAALAFSGDNSAETFAGLSHLELPEEGFEQGDVAHVPVRVIVTPQEIRLFVPAMWGAYVSERVIALIAGEEQA